MKVVDLGQYQFAGLLQPVGATSATALRTVAITARVVDVLSRVALGALIDMSLQRCRATEQDLGEHALHLPSCRAMPKKDRRVLSQ
ncbi:MAG: hypothetical protein AAF394_18125 [Planctomycetota bacterium]